LFKIPVLVLIIGIFGPVTTAKDRHIDPAWQSFSVEVDLFGDLIISISASIVALTAGAFEAQAGST